MAPLSQDSFYVIISGNKIAQLEREIKLARVEYKTGRLYRNPNHRLHPTVLKLTTDFASESTEKLEKILNQGDYVYKQF
jgi:hypothetical protein